MKSKLSALNFEYLLFEYYRELGLNNNELLVLLMVGHLIKDGNKTITNETLEVKLDMSAQEIDAAFDSLLTKKFITFQTSGDDFITSIQPAKEKLFEEYKKNLMLNSEKIDETSEVLSSLISSFEHYFNRSLSVAEVDQIRSWLNHGITYDVIKNSLMDAFNLENLSFKKIDSLIAIKMREDGEI